MKLKLCPFCGEKARIIKRKCDLSKYAIGCNTTGCHCWIPEDVRLRELHNYAPCWVKLKDAINSWDIRAESKILKMVTEELKAIRKVK